MKNHFKTSLDYIRRSPFQAFAAILVLAVTFFVATIIALLTYSSAKLLTYFETRPQVIAFLKNEATPDAISALQKKLTNDQRLKDVHFVSKEDALTIYKSATKDNPLLGELVSPSIFPASLEFSVKDLGNAQQVIDEVKKEGVVDSVGFTASVGGQSKIGDVIEKLNKITLYIRVGGIVLVSVLGATSFIVLMVIIGMRITTRRGEVDTLKLIGATSGFIRAPIILEAIIYVLIGVLLGWILASILVLYATPTIISYFGQIPIIPRETILFFELLGLILLGEVFIGSVIAALGSIISVSRALANK